MSEALERRAEIAKLARLLGREPAQLAYLEAIPSAELGVLRDQVTAQLFSAGAKSLGTLAAASRLLPVGVAASIAERVFGPVLTARVAGLVDADRAVQMAMRLSTPFLADVAVELDPRHAHDLIAQIPPELIRTITGELMRRHEFVTMGRFVGHLDPASILATLDVLDDAALLQTAFVLERKDAVQELVAMLPDAHLERVIDAAADGLWPETLGLTAYLDDIERRRLIAMAGRRDDRVLDALIDAAHAEAMWDFVLPLTALMGDAELRRFAALGSLEREGVLEGIVEAAVEDEGLWTHLVPLVAELPGPSQDRVIRHVRALPVDPAVLLARAREAGIEDRLGPLGAALSAEALTIGTEGPAIGAEGLTVVPEDLGLGAEAPALSPEGPAVGA